MTFKNYKYRHMKKIFILIIPILFLFSCKNSEKKDKDYMIKAYITGYFDGDVSLKKVRKGKLVTVDSLHMRKSKFKFKHVKINSPEMFWFVIDKGNYIIQFFADPHNMQINADFNDKGKLEVQGSKTHAEYVSFLESNSIYENKQLKVTEQKDLAYENNDTLLLKSLDSVSNSILNEQIDFLKKYVIENNKSYVSLYLTLSNLTDYLQLPQLEKIYNNLDDTLKTSAYYLELKDFISRKQNIQAGKQAPDFSLPDTSGTAISLSSFQGKYVLLSFSASWNGWCRADNKILSELNNKNGKNNFEIYQVFAEQNKQQFKNVLKADKINWTAVSDMKGLDSDVLQLYAIRKLPQYFLLDKNGIILVSSDDLKTVLPEIEKLF